MGDASTSAPATPTSTLFCLEDGNDLFLDGDDSPSGDGYADLHLAGDDYLLLLDRDDDEYVALMLSKEGAAGGSGGWGEEVDEWTKVARTVCVDWIVKTNARFRFGGKTAYVAVTYLDRFLVQRRVDRGQEWALQLLSVACLSLAAKVEEHRVPRLPEFRPDEYDFDCASILRMELLVLSTLKWQMIAGTPFPFLGCFAARLRHDERKAIVLRAVKCIFASIKAMSSVEYQPSTIALASILVARGGNKEEEGALTFPKLAEKLKAILGSSWQQLHTGHVYSCYSVMTREEDSSRSMSMRQQSSREMASSGVSVAHIGSSDSMAMGASSNNNVTTTTTSAAAAAAAAITEGNNKRRRLHSPHRH